MRKIFSKIFDILCFIVGPYLVAYHLLDFKVGPGIRLSKEKPPSYFYYYTSDSQIWFAIGICLVCLGFLIKFWKKR